MASTAEQYMKHFVQTSTSLKETVLSRGEDLKRSQLGSPLLSHKGAGRFDTIPEVFSSKIQSITQSKQISTRQSPRDDSHRKKTLVVKLAEFHKQ